MSGDLLEVLRSMGIVAKVVVGVLLLLSIYALTVDDRALHLL